MTTATTTITDTQVIEYIANYPKTNRTKTPEDSYRRTAMLTPAVVLLRDEGGLTWATIVDALGVTEGAARHAYRCFHDGAYAPSR